MNETSKIQLTLIPIAVLLAVPGCNPAGASKSGPAAPKSFRFGYVHKSEVASSQATPCYEAPPGAEQDYKDYLAETGRRLAEAAGKQQPQKALQDEITDLRTGLEARELVYGPNPGRCLHYGFSPELLYSARIVAKEKRVDIIVDPRSVYWGVEKILTNGVDLTDATAETCTLVRKLKK